MDTWDVGSLDAPILIVFDFPWVDEMVARKPIAGAGRNLLQRMLTNAGIEIDEVRMISMIGVKPATLNPSSIADQVWVDAIDRLHARVMESRGLKAIVTVGDYSTFALTGKGQVKASVRKAFGRLIGAVEDRKAGILSLRGSVYEYEVEVGEGVVVRIPLVPMLHPREVLKMDKWGKRAQADWYRVARIVRNGFERIDRMHVINPSRDEVDRFEEEVERAGENGILAIDIETWGNRLSCVGFALDRGKSITIPCTGEWWWGIDAAKRLCESKIPKVLCNGCFDWYWLDSYGIELKNYLWDVQYMHHALDPMESHSLDFLASIYCFDYIYYKDEAKDAEEVTKYARDLDALWVYNGLDCCYTRELVDSLIVELNREGLIGFYLNHYARMIRPLVRTMRHGIRVDVKAQKKWGKELKEELEACRVRMKEIAGEEMFTTKSRVEMRRPTGEEWIRLVGREVGDGEIPNAKEVNKEEREKIGYVMTKGVVKEKVEEVGKGFSNSKLLKFFYEKLGLPKIIKMSKTKDGKKKKISLDEGAIRLLMHRYKEVVEPGKVLLRFRERQKELDYLKGAWDSDGRIRCSYKMNTKAGRLSSSKNPMRKGYNLQNIKR